MERVNIPRSISVYILFAILFAAITVAFPRKARFGYEFAKGETWSNPTLTAQFDFPILKTERQLLEDEDASREDINYCFKYDDMVVLSALKDAGNLGPAVELKLKNEILRSLTDIYSKGIVSDEDIPDGAALVYVRKDKHSTPCAASDLYTLSSALDRLYANLFPLAENAASLEELMRSERINELVRVNLVPDKDGELLIRNSAAQDISPTQGYVSAGEVIIREGDTVTSEAYQILYSYKTEFESSIGYSGPLVLVWLGNGFLALLICIMLFLAVLYCAPGVFAEWNKLLYIVFCAAAFMLGGIITGVSNTEALYMVPFSLLCLYLVPFFGRNLVLAVYVATLLPLLAFQAVGLEVFVIYLTAGIVTLAAVERFSRGWRQFIMASIVFAAMLVAYLVFRFLDGSIIFINQGRILSLFLGAFLPIAGYPLIFLLEKLFSMLSETKLRELCDTNGVLLRELSVKAPGTFQHSLAVMNMADAAARCIGADVLLVRAGAMYHDIGKLSDPLCFIENQQIGSVRYHDGLAPIQSAARIVKHVPDGVELARKFNIPEDVIGFIRSHHGVSCAAYFYNKYVSEGGDPADKYLFSYQGVKPQTREQGILMICDTVEAASRTLNDNSKETFDNFVEKIVSAKISDGQLDESGLTLGDLVAIKEVLKEYLGRLYHDRVEYPSQNK